MSRYWLFDWLDAEGIRTIKAADSVIRDSRGIDRLIAAADVAKSTPPDAPDSRRSLVTGTGLDLSGVMACSRSACLKRTVDQLILRSWHYFDGVIVSGLDPNDLLVKASHRDPAYMRDFLLNQVDVALYIREIGAEDFLRFRRKLQLCTEHLEQHATEAGLQPVAEMVSELASELSRDCRVDLRETRRGLAFTYRHPALDYTRSGVIRKRMKRDRLVNAQSRYEAERLVAALTRSVFLARQAGAPLGQAALAGSRFVEVRPPHGPSVADVAFSIPLPILDGASPRDLLTLREDQADEFEVFRGALTKTIEERIKALPAENVSELGKAVLDDVLRPALAGMELRMSKSARLLRNRSAAVLASSGLVTTIGLLAFAPLTVPGLVLAAGGLVASYNDYLKDRREVDLSDLHILWRASTSRHAKLN